MKKLTAYIFTIVLLSSQLFADNDIHTGELSGDYLGESHVDSVWENTYVDEWGAYFSSEGSFTNYTRANFKNANLPQSIFRRATLTDANFTNANLTSVIFDEAILTNANFTNAIVNGAVFTDGFTEAQLKSTKSYKEKNLSGVNLWYSDLSGWDFSGQNLTSASFSGSTLTNTNFTNATVNSASFTDGFTETQLKSTKSYKEKNLTGIFLVSNDLSGWDFSGQNLTSASFSGSTLTNTNFTNATVKGVGFRNVKGFVQEQLKSTASYQEKNLAGIDFYECDVSGWDFTGQNLQNSQLSYTVLNGSDLTGADLRGALLIQTKGLPIYKNTIMFDGTIKNFSMKSGANSLIIRVYVPATTGGAMINAKIVDDATISGGAVLTLEEGAVLEISAGKTLTVSDNGEIVFDVDASADDTNIILNSGSKLVFGDNSKLTINLTGEVSETDPLHFTVIKAADDSYVLGLDTLPKDNIILNVNGTAYDSSKWGINFDPTTGNLDINVNVPEPATCAVIFGVLALGLVVYRRRK